MDFIFGNKILASLDIGAYGVKWAAMDRRKGTCYVWDAELFPDRQNRKDSPDEEATIRRLQTLVAECQKSVPVWNKKVVGSVYGNKVFYGYQEFGKTQSKFLPQAVTSALLNTLPYPLDEIQIKIAEVQPISGRSDHSAAFYGLVNNSQVDKVRKRFEGCGLLLEGVSVVPIALAKAWGKNRTDKSEEFVALVNIGYAETMVVVARGEQPYYVREIPVAGAQFTFAFQVEEHVPWAVAEQTKRAYNVYEMREHTIEPDLRKWLDEVKRSIEHFESKYQEYGHRVNRIVLSGGGACWPGLERRVEESLARPAMVDAWSGIRPVEPRAEEEALLHKVSIGSCLR